MGETGDRPQQGCLARATWPEQRDELARGHVERRVVDSDRAGILESQTADAYRRRGRRRLPTGPIVARHALLLSLRADEAVRIFAIRRSDHCTKSCSSFSTSESAASKIATISSISARDVDNGGAKNMTFPGCRGSV